ncbi:MAG: hypothetical protein P8Z42_06930 [Anaerolineales bacterium]
MNVDRERERIGLSVKRLEPDPWRYFLFKGLCLQALYAVRSGVPAAVHKGFGEINAAIECGGR